MQPSNSQEIGIRIGSAAHGSQLKRFLHVLEATGDGLSHATALYYSRLHRLKTAGDAPDVPDVQG